LPEGNGTRLGSLLEKRAANRNKPDFQVKREEAEQTIGYKRV
jgi:hypothetical protein